MSDTGAAPGLTSRAERFVRIRSVRVGHPLIESWPSDLASQGVPREVIDVAILFDETWGGLSLPPGFECDGGPDPIGFSGVIHGDRFNEDGWWIECGHQRYSVPYAFVLSPTGAFGVVAQRWVPLFASLTGWIEAVALAYAADDVAETVTSLNGTDVAALDLAGMRPVPEVGGMNVQWLYEGDRLVAVDRSHAVLFGDDRYLRGKVFHGARLATLVAQS